MQAPVFDKISSPGQTVGTEVLYGLLYTGAYYLILYLLDFIYNFVKDTGNRFRSLVPYTAAADEKAIIIQQDAKKHKDAIPIGLSVNERSGIEFSYSFYIYVNPSTFTGEAKFKHVFHKGYAVPWPLMSPGVFMHGDTNTMRVIMNTYKNPYTYVDIKNIPLEKWVHVVLNCYKGGLDIFINGNLANRISFLDTIPYQNFGNVYLFSKMNLNTLHGPLIASLEDIQFDIQGAFSGYLSDLKYARYALSMSEIQDALNKGPTEKIEPKNMQKPPYLADNWWSVQA